MHITNDRKEFADTFPETHEFLLEEIAKNRTTSFLAHTYLQAVRRIEDHDKVLKSVLEHLMNQNNDMLELLNKKAMYETPAILVKTIEIASYLIAGYLIFYLFKNDL